MNIAIPSVIIGLLGILLAFVFYKKESNAALKDIRITGIVL